MKVVHCKKEKYDVYIGRKKSGMHYGNPFSHKEGTLAKYKVATRKDSIIAYRKWLIGEAYQDVEPERRQWILDHLKELKDKILGCWCSPLACHGDVLIGLIEEMDNL